MEDRIVCHCLDISYNDIKKAVEDGAKTLDEVKEATDAGTVCGACEDEIQEIINEVTGK